MKKVLVAAVSSLLVVLALVMLVGANTANPVTVTLNGNVVDCASYGQPATIVEDRTLVPLRAIFESLGADIIWDNASRTVISVRGGDTVELAIGSNVLMKNKQPVEVDVPARIMSDRTMVPVRVIAESFGVKVDWENSTRTVILECDANTFPKTISPKSEHKDKHLYGDFYYGMTMQKAWDAVDENEGEKTVVSYSDGHSEIHISDKEAKYANEDARITGSENCALVSLSFADDYLYKVQVTTSGVELEKAIEVRGIVAECYGEGFVIRADGGSDESDKVYEWNIDGQVILCSISEASDGTYACRLSVTDASVEKLLLQGPDKENIPAEEDKKEQEKEPAKDKDSDDEEEEKSDKEPDGDEEKNDNIGSVEDANDDAVAALEAYLEACNTFNFTLLSDCCIDSFGMDKFGIESLEDALEYAGVSKEGLSAIMIEKTYKGNEAYIPLADAVIDVVLGFVSDASNLLYYSVDGVVSEKSDKVVFEVTHFAPDISVMGEIFAGSFDRAIKKAFADGTVSFSMTQEQMMPILSEIAADELEAAFNEMLDTDTFVSSGSEKVSVVRSGNNKWLVELDENESEFIKAVKKGGSEILELFGFEV